MIERDVIVTTKHGGMPTFLAAPEGGDQHPGIIFYMDAPGIREELRNMARRIAKHGYVCLLPDMYYRLGTVRFDIPRRDDGMSGVIRASMNHLTNARVIDDTAGLLAYFDALDIVTPGKVGCVGHCMSGQYITTVAAKFPHRMAAAASLYGVGIVTDKEDSPHLLVGEVKGELYYAFAEHGKAQCLAKTKGFVKMMADPVNGRILGAAVIGPDGSELIHEVIVAMNFGATVAQFMRIPHLHPTLAEIWTYPAEICAAQLGMKIPGDEQLEVATSVDART